jgi:phenylalanyl-tRNA synthetase alpha chain
MDLEKILFEAQAELQTAKTVEALENIRIKYLGRKGIITTFIKELANLSLEERRVKGQLVNKIKEELTLEIDRKRALLEAQRKQETYTKKTALLLPGRKPWLGNIHPISKTLDEIIGILVSMGFEEKLGPEIETEWYNYSALNFPPDHPARDQIACFYLGTEELLRSHTSPIQIRILEREKPPVRIVAPGRVFRPDAFDASHSPVFYQVEGLYVDQAVTFCELKGTLEVFCRKMFGSEVGVRFVPSYFPFTEPSAEISISCVICGGKGCKTCKNTGWLEILGAGMVHPKVLENVGYDSEKYSGFAFGLGVERIAMIRYRIDDIRLFYENDIRFLAQF